MHFFSPKMLFHYSTKSSYFFQTKTKGEFIMINDFGEKIGGARKDLWKERGLMIEDLDGMTQGEKEKYVKKRLCLAKRGSESLSRRWNATFCGLLQK